MKISNRLKKIMYFIIPHLLYIALFSYFYNYVYTPVGDSFEILYREVLVLSLIYFIIFLIIYLLLRIKIDEKKCFFIIIALILLSFEMFYTSLLMCFIIFSLLIITLIINDNVKGKLAFFISYVIVILFLVNFSYSTIYAISTLKRCNDENIENKIIINEKEDLPNIYWIHCDGMINFDDAEKYFRTDISEFKDYLFNNKYYVNNDASFYSKAHTVQALIALYNPNYYDYFFEDYLNNLKNTNYEDDIISYDKLNDIRLKNELFEAFEKKGYKFLTISDFNQYASFYTDYMFDYYSFQKSKEVDLDYFTAEENSYEDILKYIDYSHLKTLADTTFLHFLTDDYNFLKHEEVDYHKLDYSKYEYINKSEYWKAKAILTSLDIVYKKNDEKLFTFIDYSINHTPWLYDNNGKVVNSQQDGFLPKNFKSNYEYSTYILMDVLKYIRDVDEEAIVILQGDHGIHTVSPYAIAEYSGFSVDEVKKISDSTISAIYIPKKYLNGDEDTLDDPLNISRYLVNNFVGENYKYIE